MTGPAMPKPKASFVEVTGLEPDAIEVVERIVARMRKGQEQYGPLDLDSNLRNWRLEANEEYLDAAVYLAMKTLKDERAQTLSQLENRVVRAYCTPREIDWIEREAPLLLVELKRAEKRGDMEEARALALRHLKGKRDILEAVRKRMDGEAA